jgi:hypothetical protein
MLLGVKITSVGPALLVNVVETVNVQPKLFVKVITGVPAPKPVTVCPETEPILLAKLTVCGGAAGDVFEITITPFVAPQFGFVNVKVPEGLGFVEIATVLVTTHPLASVTIIEYVPNAMPDAVVPVPPLGCQLYVYPGTPPEALTEAEPVIAQLGTLTTVDVGGALIVTTVDDVETHPPLETVCVTV